MDIDSYIARFKTLLEQAGYQTTDKGALKLFKKGLPTPLNIRIITNVNPIPETLDDWIKAAREQQLRWLQIQEVSGKFNPQHATIAHGLKNRGHGQQQRRDPNAMDVDFGGAGAPKIPYQRLTDEEREDLRKKGACFRCRKQGHLSRACPGNQYQGNPTSRQAPSLKAQGETPKAKMTREELKKILQDDEVRQDLFDEIVDSGFV